MIKIMFKNFEGYLNTNTDEVSFYHFKYKNITDAIKIVENDIESSKQEIEIFNRLMDQILIE